MRGSYSARWGESQDLGANYYIPAQLAYLSLFLTESLLSGTQPLQISGLLWVSAAQMVITDGLSLLPTQDLAPSSL